MNEGHEASDAIKVKKNKKADFKTYIRSFSEIEREREKVKNLEELREGRTAGAGAEEATSQRQISDDRSTVWRLQISDRAPEQRPISDLR